MDGLAEGLTANRSLRWLDISDLVRANPRPVGVAVRYGRLVDALQCSAVEHAQLQPLGSCPASVPRLCDLVRNSLSLQEIALNYSGLKEPLIHSIIGAI